MEGKKAASLCVLKILQKYSDEDHPLKQKDILDLVEKDYGIKLERKSVGNTLDMLEDFDFELQRLPGGGVYLAERTFDPSMVSFLIDAIFSSKSLTGSQAKELLKSIGSTLSIHDRDKYTYAIHKSNELTRTNNKEALYNASIITEAIHKKKRIAYKYLEYNEEGKLVPRFSDTYEYHATPYYLVNNYGNYYCLLTRTKFPEITAYRLDYMKDIRIYEEDKYSYKPITEIPGYENGFDIAEYLNEHVYLFGGKVSRALIELKKPQAQQYVRDWFGKVKIYKRDGKQVADFKCDESALFYWVMQYNEHVRVIEPESVINKIKQAAVNLHNEYK